MGLGRSRLDRDRPGNSVNCQPGVSPYFPGTGMPRNCQGRDFLGVPCLFLVRADQCRQAAANIGASVCSLAPGFHGTAREVISLAFLVLSRSEPTRVDKRLPILRNCRRVFSGVVYFCKIQRAKERRTITVVHCFLAGACFSSDPEVLDTATFTYINLKCVFTLRLN